MLEIDRALQNHIDLLVEAFLYHNYFNLHNNYSTLYVHKVSTTTKVVRLKRNMPRGERQ